MGTNNSPFVSFGPLLRLSQSDITSDVFLMDTTSVSGTLYSSVCQGFNRVLKSHLVHHSN